MQNRLHPVIQALALLIIPAVVIFIINYILSITGKTGETEPLGETIKMLIFVIPSALYIILHKYKLSYLTFVIAIIATIILVKSVSNSEIEHLSTFSLYLFNFVYFILFVALTYLAYFRISGFKLKNIIFIVGGVIIHTISLIGLLLVNKQTLDLTRTQEIIYTGTNLYLMVGLALAIGLLFFELPQQKQDAEYGYYDDDDDDLPHK